LVRGAAPSVYNFARVPDRSNVAIHWQMKGCHCVSVSVTVCISAADSVLVRRDDSSTVHRSGVPQAVPVLTSDAVTGSELTCGVVAWDLQVSRSYAVTSDAVAGSELTCGVVAWDLQVSKSDAVTSGAVTGSELTCGGVTWDLQVSRSDAVTSGAVTGSELTCGVVAWDLSRCRWCRELYVLYWCREPPSERFASTQAALLYTSDPLV
jgi:hypothetical protein